MHSIGQVLLSNGFRICRGNTLCMDKCPAMIYLYIYIRKESSEFAVHKMLLGTHVYNEGEENATPEPNYLMIAEVTYHPLWNILDFDILFNLCY